MAFAALGAGGQVAGGLASLYATLFPDRTAINMQRDIAMRGLDDARNNQAYMRLLNTIGLQRSTAGSQDAQGSETYYDPATNTWKSRLGALPQQVQTAGDLAAISRNTTDLRDAQAANAEAIARAHAAQPGADAARRELENFRPTSAGDVTDLLVRNIADTTNQTQRPITQDLIRNAARTGSAADSQVEAMGRSSADQIRKSIMEATIQGKTGAGQINAANLQPLQQRFAALQGGTSPSLQYSQIDQNDPNKTMQALLADRMKTGATAPFGGMQGLGYGQYGANQAAQQAIGAQTTDPLGASIMSAGKQLSDFFASPTLFGTAEKPGYFRNMFGNKSTSSSTTPNTGWLNYNSKGFLDPM